MNNRDTRNMRDMRNTRGNSRTHAAAHMRTARSTRTRRKRSGRNPLERMLLTGVFIVVLIVIIIYGISLNRMTRDQRDAFKSILSSAENLDGAVTEMQDASTKALATQADLDRMEAVKRLKANDIDGLKVVFLTFDDGPSIYTSDVLDTLKTYNVPATFFSKRGDTELAQSVWPRMIAEGHTLANHTWSHNYDLYDTPDAFYADVQAEEDFQKEITGTEPSGLFRFPGGSLNANETCVQGIVDRGYNYVDWNVSSTDASAEPPAVETIVNVVVEGCHQHDVSVVLCHAEVKENTRAALPTIIQTLQSEGYIFLAMDKDFSYPRQLEV